MSTSTHAPSGSGGGGDRATERAGRDRRAGGGEALAGRVLMITENKSVPADRRVWNEARTLAAAGWEVTIVSPAEPGLEQPGREVREGVEIHRFQLHPSAGGVAGYLREYSQAVWRIRGIVRRLAEERRFDVVHASNPPDFLLLAARSARRRGASFVFDHHDLGPELYRTRFADGGRALELAMLAVERLAFRMADVTLASNETYREVALRRGRMRPENVFVVRNGPDLRRFRPTDPDPALRRGRGHLLAYVGVMGPQDGIDHALRALAWLRGRRTDWHAIFAGAGEVMGQMRALASELALDGHVEFAGWLGDRELRSLLSTADVCIAPDPPSPFNDVSTMIKLSEYMAMGRPVVGYDLAESRATAGDAALYADDPEGLGRCLERLLSDPARRERMGALAAERAASDLGWEHAERSLLAAYDRALARSALRAAPAATTA